MFCLSMHVTGQPDKIDIGTAVSIGYTIDKLDDEEVFVIDLSTKVCPDQSDCVLDVEIIRDHKIPIPLCNMNFSLSLPGKYEYET